MIAIFLLEKTRDSPTKGFNYTNKGRIKQENGELMASIYRVINQNYLNTILLVIIENKP